MRNIPSRHERREVQPTPAMQTSAAEQTQSAIGLMFPVRPQLRDANRKLGIG